MLFLSPFISLGFLFLEHRYKILEELVERYSENGLDFKFWRLVSSNDPMYNKNQLTLLL